MYCHIFKACISLFNLIVWVPGIWQDEYEQEVSVQSFRLYIWKQVYIPLSFHMPFQSSGKCIILKPLHKLLKTSAWEVAVSPRDFCLRGLMVFSCVLWGTCQQAVQLLIRRREISVRCRSMAKDMLFEPLLCLFTLLLPHEGAVNSYWY